ncbi:hypothetical protein OR16_07791 [Cupriavidus basilensis OR16]|uniref:Uncharacterized protein n=1 Tax=Cupriavidus basilensis OR16 TaxID=1127483 RepID=H1S1L7_9BURK|nr:virulence factor TspB C-terminal domain-related protein [Cupriavidus basilensis]EHP43592.1 hypothetical protein OR16_07791 [Cupriavidus basilensis OR16]
MASNAGQIAVGALRINPAGLATSVVLSWAAQYGLQKCATGAWDWCHTSQPAQTPTEGWDWFTTGLQMHASSIEDAAVKVMPLYSAKSYVVDESSSTTFVIGLFNANGNRITGVRFNKQPGCASGYVLQANGTCLKPAQTLPAVDADWQAAASAMTDALAMEIMKGNVSLPLDSPMVDTKRQIVPLSNPYYDPVTGKTFQDVGYVTPNSDGKTADLQVAKQEVDPATGEPAKDASGVAAQPQKADDPCLGHEKWLGCMELGDVPTGPDLGKNSKTISITPDGGWGADTMACPADLTTTLRNGGTTVAYSFKPACDGADMFRPIIIGMAWVGAVLIALGVGRKGD